MSRSLNPTRNNFFGSRIDPTTADGSHSGGLIASALLHVGIIAATLVTLSQARLQIEDQSPPIVPVDLVTIADKTNIAPTVRELPKVQDVKIQPVEPDQLQMKVPAVPEQAELAPPPEPATPAPTLPKPRPVTVQKTKPQDKPVEKKKAAEEDFSALLNKLTSPSAAPKNARVASRTQRGFGAENAMTMELEDALRNEIEQCMDWGPLAGAPNAENIVVSVTLTLNGDGSVAAIAPNPTRGPYETAAMSAALRAIHVCAPYKLPADRYADWRESEVRFSPKDMLNQ